MTPLFRTDDKIESQMGSQATTHEAEGQMGY